MPVQPVNLLLGPGELFFKRDTDVSGKYMRVGNLKGPVTFTYETDTVEQRPGNSLLVVRRDKIAERAMLSAGIADFKISQLIAALGLSLSTTQITLTQTHRAWEELAFGSITTTKTLANTAVSTTSVVITSIDAATKYVKGTDFTVPSTTKVKPILAGFANKTQLTAYDVRDTAARAVRIGDKLTLQQVDLKFTHKQRDGKFVSIEIPIATITGGLTIPFEDVNYTTYNITFSALGDTTAARGRRLFNIIREIT